MDIKEKLIKEFNEKGGAFVIEEPNNHIDTYSFYHKVAQVWLNSAFDRIISARDEEWKKVIKDNKEKWIMGLMYMADENFEQHKVAKAHLDVILNDLINSMK